MNSPALENLIAEYSRSHLICDASCPLITETTLEEEALIYGLPHYNLDLVFKQFLELTAKKLDSGSETSQLSGGQKVILMILLALHSKADNIMFANLDVSIDPERLRQIRNLLDQFRSRKKEILII